MKVQSVRVQIRHLRAVRVTRSHCSLVAVSGILKCQVNFRSWSRSTHLTLRARAAIINRRDACSPNTFRIAREANGSMTGGLHFCHLGPEAGRWSVTRASSGAKLRDDFSTPTTASAAATAWNVQPFEVNAPSAPGFPACRGTACRPLAADQWFARVGRALPLRLVHARARAKV